MTRFTQLLGIALLSAAVSAEPQQQAPENENERQPGMLRIPGIQDTDRVLLDGELIGDGAKIARFGSKLLVNPGEYTVTIISGNRQSCEHRVNIRENHTATATCDTQQTEEFVD